MYGIGPQILNWLSSFLYGRSQCVYIDDCVCLSCCLSLAESHRGQFLDHCSYYMLTISQMLFPVQIKMFAYDTKFYYAHLHHDGTAIMLICIMTALQLLSV